MNLFRRFVSLHKEIYKFLSPILLNPRFPAQVIKVFLCGGIKSPTITVGIKI